MNESIPPDAVSESAVPPPPPPGSDAPAPPPIAGPAPVQSPKGMSTGLRVLWIVLAIVGGVLLLGMLIFGTCVLVVNGMMYS